MLAVYLVMAFTIDPKDADGAVRGLAFLYLLIWYFSAGRAQGRYIKASLGSNYPRRPWAKPVAIAIGALLAYLVAGILVSAFYFAATGSGPTTRPSESRVDRQSSDDRAAAGTTANDDRQPDVAKHANLDKTLRPEAEVLGTAGGAYIGSHEYIAAFKRTSCGYAMKEHFRSAADVRLLEIDPHLPPSAIVQSYAGQEHRKWLVNAWKVVPDMIEQARVEYDPKTSCGIAAGSLVAIRAHAKTAWERALAEYAALP